jgi:hypothetical protein
MFDAARSRLRLMTQNVEQIMGVIENARLSAVQAARAELGFVEERLANLLERLPKAREARAALSSAMDAHDAAEQVRFVERTALVDAIERTASNLRNAELGLEGAARRAAIELGQREAQEEAYRLQGLVKDLLDEVRQADPGSAAAASAKERLAAQRKLLETAEERVSTIADQVERAVEAQHEAVARHRAEATRLEAEHAASYARTQQEDGEIARLTEQARAFSDFAFPDPGVTVERARADVASARAAVDTAASATDPRLAAQLAAAQQQQDDAYYELARLAEFYDSVRRQVEAGSKLPADPTGGTSQRSLIGKVATAVWYPVETAIQMTGEVVFGVGQSPTEIWDILMAGKRNIAWFEIRRQQVERAIRTRQRTVTMLRGRLDQCVLVHSRRSTG